MTWEQAINHIRTSADHERLVRDFFFDDPLEEACDRYWRSTEWAAIRAIVGSGRGRAALDIGAGRGIASYALAKDGWQVTALEPDPSSLVGAGAIKSLVAATSVPITVVQTWGENLPFTDNEFDLVFCRQALHHAKDLSQLIREMARVTRKNGLVIAVREHVLSKLDDLDEFLAAHPLHSLYGGEHAYLLKDYTSSLTSAGLRLQRVLNPLESDINLYPLTKGKLKQQIARKWRLPSERLIPDWVLRLKGALMTIPGRTYSFVARKL